MLKRLFMAVLAFTMIWGGERAFAQNAVSGKVTDSSGEPIVGAGILIKGTTSGTTTDLDGNWHLTNVRTGAVLEFSSIGYATTQVTVGSAQQYNVILKEDALYLDDVVVIGYGSAKRNDLTGSIAQVNGDLIAATNASSASKALEGAIPGLVFSIVDGQPGVDAGIRVRGLGSTNAGYSNALVVIDGVPAQTENPLSQLSQEDIASVTVLKDAASTAIYGSRGANGVVLVTTKKGESGKTKVGFQARCTRRKGRSVVYMKDGEQISDFLGAIGATKSLMKLENARILRDIAGNINRQVNFEAANLKKTGIAAMRQLEDIQLIERTIGISSLSPALAQAARLRAENPDGSLQELAQASNPPVGKSGINHRLQRLGEIAERLREKEEGGAAWQ